MSLTSVRLLTSMLPLLLVASMGCSGPDDTVPDFAPVVAITFPEADELLREKRIRVKGTAEHTDEVMINGTPASVVGGVWSAEVPFDEGMATATVEARGVSESVTFRIDASPPQLAITSPQRAAFISKETSTTSVSGTVTDSVSGLSLLKVNEQIISVGEDGSFAHDLQLAEGLNTLDITAVDLAGNTTQTIMGVVHGDFVDPVERVDPGLGITIDKAVLGKITQVISALITPDQVSALLAANLDTEATVSLTSIDFSPVEIEAVPKSNTQRPQDPGFIDFEVTVKDVVIQGVFALSSADDIELEVTLTEATVTTAMTLTANEQGSLDVAFSQPVLEIEDDALNWAVRAGGTELNNEDSRLLSNIVDTIVEVAFSEILSEQVIEQLYDPALLNRRVTLLGRTLEFQLRLEEIITNASGIFVSTTFTMPAEAFGEIPDVPGALALTQGPTASPGVRRDALLTVNEQAVNRLLHGVWRSGLLNQTLSGQDFAGFELPFELEAGALALALDGRITNHAENSSPAGLAMRPQLPPIIQLGTGEEGDESNALIANLGELHIDLLLDVDKATPKKLVTFALFLELGVMLEVKPNNRLGINLSFTGQTDLIDEPLFDLDDHTIEALMQSVFELVPALLTEQLELDGEADIDWLKITNPEVVIHGLERDQLSVGLDFEADPSSISLGSSE